jgi:hypothetical protein
MFNNLFSVPATSSILALLVGTFAISRAASGQRDGESSPQTGDEQASSYTRPAVNSHDPAGAER